jgi:protease I
MMIVKKVLMIVSTRNFCDEEYYTCRAVFESAGLDCAVASSEEFAAVGMEGSLVKPDLHIKNITLEWCDALCFIGGVGCTEYWHDKEVHQLALRANRAGLLICAICLAPVILANAGLLKNKCVTAYPSAKRYLKKKGVIYIGNSVETDENIITAKNPEAAEEFAHKICEMLETDIS